MANTEIIRSIPDGELYAVTFEEHEIVAAAGPLHHSEVDAAIEQGFDSDPELVDDLNAQWAVGAAVIAR